MNSGKTLFGEGTFLLRNSYRMNGSTNNISSFIHFLDTNAPAHPFRFYRTVP